MIEKMKEYIIKLVRKHRIQLSMLGVLLSIIALSIIASPHVFLRYHTYAALMTTVPFVIVLALPLTLIVISGEFDLSFPSIMGLSAMFFAIEGVRYGNIALGIITGLGVGLFAGILNGVLITKARIPSIVTTLGMMFFWRGFINVYSGGVGVPMAVVRGSPLWTVLVSRIGGFPVQALWAFAFVFIFWLLLNRHKFGSHVYAIGDNVKSARYIGVNTDRVKIILFALVGVFASFAGIVACLENLNFWPTMGGGYLLIVLAAVFVGGTPTWGGVGTIFGTLIGAIMLGLIDISIIAAGFSGFWNQLIYGLIIVISVIFNVHFRGQLKSRD